MAILFASAMPWSIAHFDGVDQVVVHLQAPLAVAGVEELLAVSGGAAVVHLEHRVAAVGEPLRVGAVTPCVARPRAAVHEEHEREALCGQRRRAASDRCSGSGRRAT